MDAAFELEVSADVKLKDAPTGKLADIDTSSSLADWSAPMLVTESADIVKMKGRPIHGAMEFNMPVLLKDAR
eukprot:3930-Alexandrium_andersonii.AAC.1